MEAINLNMRVQPTVGPSVSMRILNKVSFEELQGTKDGDVVNAKALSALINNSGDATKLESEVNTLKSSKVDKVSGKGLSTNDYTNADKNKVSSTATELATLKATVKALTDRVAALEAA